MCGIAGIISRNMVGKDVDYFRFLLFLNQLRGTDSTGAFYIEEHTNSHKKRLSRGAGLPARLIKSDEAAQSFMMHKNVDKFLSAYGPSKMAFVGHTRAATVGAIHEDNAHPFSFDRVIGVVNGTVTKSEIPGEEEYDTDSEAMLAYMNDVGLEKALPNLLGLTRAGFAMVFYHRPSNTMNFLRSATGDDTRPLSFALSKNKDTLSFSSESGMLRFAAERMGYDLEPYEYLDEETGKTETYGPKVWQYKVNQLVTVPLEKDFYSKITVTDIEPNTELRPKPKYIAPPNAGGSKEYVGGFRGHVPSSAGGANGLHESEYINWRRYTDKPATSAKTSVENNWNIGKPKTPSSDSSEKIYRGPQGSLISASRFEKLMSRPCASCSMPFSAHDTDLDTKIAWVKSDAGWEPVCEDCRDLQFMSSFICDDPREDK